MRNQTSFRLTTTLLPSDTTAKTTTVINKLDAGGNKFYPTFTEETVVLTNDDRTIMETTRAICTDWNITFVKRWLSDDNSETEIANRKLTWNPWSIAFITAWASDLIDIDDDITWTWKQTYTDDMVSQWKATYRGLLVTEKWVKYPSFADITELEAYEWAFGGMFATVDDTWELYRYNAVTEQWDLVSTVEIWQYIIRESSTKPPQWTASNILTVSPEQNWIYLWDKLLVDWDYIQQIAKAQVTGFSSIWSFLKLAKASWTAHNISIGTDTSYTFTWMWYINIWNYYWYALEINWIEIFKETFTGGNYDNSKNRQLYTMWAWDSFRIYRPWTQWAIGVTVVDYY